MKIVYLTRTLQPIAVSSVMPGDTYSHPDYGECRRVTAKRFCLAAERLGKESEAFQRLLCAIGGAAEDDAYEGRSVVGWYGLVGLDPPEIPAPQFVGVNCPECGCFHYVLEERGVLWEKGVCGPCWSSHFIVPHGGKA